jgi:protocatechuate 3,4-dioxygenase beta subunit
VLGREDFASGQVSYITGRVTDRAGQRIDGARVEIWQCDSKGVYHHPRHRGSPDEDFQGFGALATNRDGEYYFRTLRPTPYVGRTPHIHFRVSAEGFDRLTTQLYMAQESERNSRDSLYKRHTPQERALVTVDFEPLGADPSGPVAANFNIVLG